MTKHVIIDFDNTMGVRGCDVDDGLALLFLLGHKDIVIDAVCTTYGNSELDIVHKNTIHLFSELGLNIPVYRGALSAREVASEAAYYLAEQAAAYPGKFSVLATGSLTNLKGAATVDPNFFENITEVAIMGGVTESLVIKGKIMNELNLSCDPTATYMVLSAPCQVTVATAQNCLPAFFRQEDFARTFGEKSWLSRTCAYWFDDMHAAYRWEGFTCWDVVAAAWLARPDLFTNNIMEVTLNERFFSVGLLEQASKDAPHATIQVPRISNAPSFIQETLDAWTRGLETLDTTIF